MRVVVKPDTRGAVAKLQAADKATKLSAAIALTKTMGAVKEAQLAEMRRVFENPTPYALNALFLRPATPAKLEAKVWVKDKADAGKGTPAEYFLGPGVFGGKRRLKRFESALRRIGVLLPGMAVVPGGGAKLDQFGNADRGEMIQVLSALQAFGEVGYRANATKKTSAKLAKGTKDKGGLTYFVLRHKRGRLRPGIYKRLTSTQGVSLIYAFVREPRYDKRWDFFKVAERTARAVFPVELRKQLRADFAHLNRRR
jgi:hypothetical protein